MFVTKIPSGCGVRQFSDGGGGGGGGGTHDI